MKVITEDTTYAGMKPGEFRKLVRRGEYRGNTLSVCRGYARTALAVVPRELAFDFFLFCQRYPSVVPVIDVTDAGSPHPLKVAPDADLRKDLSSYFIYVNGELEAEVHDITSYWRDDLVAFLTGCSRPLDDVLTAAGVRFRLIGVYNTNVHMKSGRFQGRMRVTCRLVKGGANAVRTVQIASRYPAFHGAPIHIGAPAYIGIRDLYHPDVFALSETIAPQEPDEVAMFWGCGMSLKSVAMESKPSLMITDGDAAMFVTDLTNEELAITS